VETSIPPPAEQAHYRGHFVIRPGLPHAQVNVTDPGGAIVAFADLPTDVVGTAGWDWGLHKLGWHARPTGDPNQLGSTCDVQRITPERSDTE
jgi:hypothetical protein